MGTAGESAAQEGAGQENTAPDRVGGAVLGAAAEPDRAQRALRRRKAARTLAPLAVAGLIAGGVAVAPAFGDSGPPSLPPITAQDLLAKVAAANVPGFSGTVQYTANLGLPQLPAMDGLDLGQLALLSGTHTLHVAAASGGKARIGIYESMAEEDVIADGDNVWTYDSSTHTATHLVPGPDATDKSDTRQHPDATTTPPTPQQAAQQVLQAVDPTTAVTVDGTEKVAGRSAYTLALRPRQAGSLVGEVAIAIDSATGVPLRVRIIPAGSGTAALDVAFTDVSLTAPAASTFAFTPPPGTTVKTETPQQAAGLGQGTTGAQDEAGQRPEVIGTGWTAVVELPSANLSAAITGAAGSNGSGGGSTDKGDSSQQLLSSVLDQGQHVTGPFGSGRIISTRLVTLLVTDDGRLYAGAVTPAALEAAAAQPTPAASTTPSGSTTPNKAGAQ